MNSKIALIVLILSLSLRSYGQLNKMPIEEIVDRIRQVDLFIKYGKFKAAVEDKVKLLAEDDKISPDDYDKLESGYHELRQKYNRFLEVIKADLSKWSQIKAMAKNPDRFALKYMDEYEAVLTHHKSSFSKTLDEVENNINKAKGTGKSKGLGLDLILMIVEEAKPIIVGIIDWIKQRKDDKDENKNKILSAINEKLFDPLEMKDWDDIVKVSKDNGTDKKENKKNKLSHIENEDLTLIDNEDFMGSLYFTWCTEDCDNKNSNAEKIDFKETAKSVKSKSIETTGKFEPKSEKFQKALRFTSKNSFDEEGYMQLKINTEAAVYVFAYNSEKEDKKIEPIYPFPAEELRKRGYSDEQIGTKSKSIEVTPFFLTSNDGSLTIPAPIIQNGKEQPFFMKVVPDSKEDYVVVLISKKQLPNDTYQEIEDADGSNLETRLFNVLGKQLMSSDIESAEFGNNEGVISFDASKLEEGLVLGLIFVIRH